MGSLEALDFIRFDWPTSEQRKEAVDCITNRADILFFIRECYPSEEDLQILKDKGLCCKILKEGGRI